MWVLGIHTQNLKLVYQALYPEQFPNLSMLIVLRDLPLTSIKADSDIKIILRIKTEILEVNRGLQALLKSAAAAAVWCHGAWQIPRARCRAVPWYCFCSLSLTGGHTYFPWHTPEQMGT